MAAGRNVKGVWRGHMSPRPAAAQARALFERRVRAAACHAGGSRGDATRARDERAQRGERLGWSRRQFLTSAAGMAAGLVALQACNDEERAARSEHDGAVRRTDRHDGSRRTDVDHARRRAAR